MSDPEDNSDLIAAVIGCDIALVESLLETSKTRSVINEWNSVSRTPLSVAVDSGNVMICNQLLKHGANADTVSYDQITCCYETPLTTAARLADDGMTELLLHYVKDIAQNQDTGKTALHWAATHGNIALVKTLVSRGADVNRVGPSGHTALHYAAISDKCEVVRWLVQNGAAVTVNNEGRSPLHIAAVRGCFEIVRQLLDAGCTTVSRDNFNFTPLALACLRNHMPVVVRLVDSQTNVDLNDGLRRAAESSHVDIMQYLLSHERCDVDSLNEHGESALSVAACRGQLQAVRFLLTAGANMNVVDTHGRTPLVAALTRYHVDIAIELTINGASFAFLETELVKKPLQMALELTSPVVLKYFLLAGCIQQGYNLESFLSAQTVEDRLQNMNYAVTASLRFKWEMPVVKDTWNWLAAYAVHTKTLKQWSRIALRRHLSLACSGRSILNRIDKLPLPLSVKCYIRFDDILDE